MKERNTIKPNYVSLVTHQLYMAFNNRILASGTGFNYKDKDGNYYLVTNWHNVSGRNHITKECLRGDAAIPNVISLMFRSKDVPGVCHRKNIKLYNDKNEPIWLEHPKSKEKIDVVVIPLKDELLVEYKIYSIFLVSY